MMFTPNTNNKNGFTLAEVLITLTIIGVIAALTIPNLMQKYQEHATVNKVKKFYSTLTNAYTQAVKEYGEIDGSWTYETVYENIFKPYFKIQKVCKNDFCGYSPATQYLNGKAAWGYGNNKDTIISLILEDGSYLWIASNSNIYFFVNPNKNSSQIWGKNIFAFTLKNNDDKVYPECFDGVWHGDTPIQRVQQFCLSTTRKNGTCCTPWLIYKGNMDYLHCDDLTWNGKNKCSK